MINRRQFVQLGVSLGAATIIPGIPRLTTAQSVPVIDTNSLPLEAWLLNTGNKTLSPELYQQAVSHIGNR